MRMRACDEDHPRTAQRILEDMRDFPGESWQKDRGSPSGRSSFWNRGREINRALPEIWPAG